MQLLLFWKRIYFWLSPPQNYEWPPGSTSCYHAHPHRNRSTVQHNVDTQSWNCETDTKKRHTALKWIKSLKLIEIQFIVHRTQFIMYRQLTVITTENLDHGSIVSSKKSPKIHWLNSNFSQESHKQKQWTIMVKEWKFCCIWFRFVLWSKKLTHFCLFNFLAVSYMAKKKYNFLFSCKLYASSWVLFVDIFLIFGHAFIELWINEVLKPDLVSVVTVHMVYLCAFARSEIFHKTPGNLGWLADSLMQESIG